VHPGNVIEEESLYSALLENRPLLENGRVRFLMPTDRRTIESYGELWGIGMSNHANPSYFRGHKVTAKDLRIVDARVNRLKQLKVSTEIDDQQKRRAKFSELAEGIASRIPNISKKDKRLVASLSKQSSPLGRIRTEVIDGKYKSNASIRLLTSLLNLAFYTSVGQKRHAWLNLGTPVYRNMINQLPLGFLVTGSAIVPIEELVGFEKTWSFSEIPADEFSELADSRGCRKYREAIKEVLYGEKMSSYREKKSVERELVEIANDTIRDDLISVLRRHNEAERYLNKLGERALFCFSVIAMGVPNLPLAASLTLIALGMKSTQKFAAPIQFFRSRLHDSEFRSLLENRSN
jgi:hypothetical protein